ncbi:MAG TPA: hypothetical protein PLN54_09590 [Flavobacteriales bacterium]|nr:hypothetical protein [Flavobacteriales bacterium]
MSFADTVVKMGVMRWCVLGLLGFLVLPVSAFYIHLHGVVTEYATGEGMKGVQVRLVKDSVERETVITPWNGTYELYLERGYDYIVWFHREDLVTKHVRIDAREIPLRPDVPFYDMDVQVTMFTWIEGFDFSIFDQPVGMAEYKHSVRNLNWDIDYTERLRPEVARVMTHYEREVAARQKKAVRQGSTAKRRGGRKRVFF